MTRCASFSLMSRHRCLMFVVTTVGLCTASTRLEAQGQLMRLMARLDSAEAIRDFARARDIADSAYLITGGQPDLLFVGAMNAARLGDTPGAISRMRRAVAAGFMHAEAASKDSAFSSLAAHRDWIAILADARARSRAIDAGLRQELLELAREDQANRMGVEAVVSRFGRGSTQGDSVFAALERADAPIQQRLRAIVALHGWPTRRMVGDDGAHAAWLVLQHMPAGDQRRLLPLVQAAALNGEARAGDAALLEDRVLVADGKPQRYGTQLHWPEHGGVSTLEPLEDAACVDKRRAEVLLPPLSDYLAQFGIAYTPPAERCSH